MPAARLTALGLASLLLLVIAVPSRGGAFSPSIPETDSKVVHVQPRATRGFEPTSTRPRRPTPTDLDPAGEDGESGEEPADDPEVSGGDDSPEADDPASPELPHRPSGRVTPRPSIPRGLGKLDPATVRRLAGDRKPEFLGLLKASEALQANLNQQMHRSLEQAEVPRFQRLASLGDRFLRGLAQALSRKGLGTRSLETVRARMQTSGDYDRDQLGLRFEAFVDAMRRLEAVR